MPHLPNWQEFKGAGQGPQKDATEIYDSYYGRYVDKASAPKPSEPKPPETNPHPFSLEG